jgi:hypothetical protein
MAASFAAHKHEDRRRKDAGASPHMNNPLTLATILHEEGGVDDAAVIIANRMDVALWLYHGFLVPGDRDCSGQGESSRGG